MCRWFRERGVTDIATFGDEPPENVFFRLPAELLRNGARSQAGSSR
jgi:hypothetical protein